MIQLTAEERKTVETIIRKAFPGAKVFVFGSRATGINLKPFSDLDLAVDAQEALTLEQLSLAKEAFTESDLPFRVDLVELKTISPEFRDAISPQLEELSV